MRSRKRRSPPECGPHSGQQGTGNFLETDTDEDSSSSALALPAEASSPDLSARDVFAAAGPANSASGFNEGTSGGPNSLFIHPCRRNSATSGSAGDALTSIQPVARSKAAFETADR